MKTDTDNLLFHIESTVRDILRDQARVDIEAAVQTIRDYVFKKHEDTGEARRYEDFYQMTGKAAVIARAWLQNFGSRQTDPSQTADSIRDYIVNTYGAY